MKVTLMQDLNLSLDNSVRKLVTRRADQGPDYSARTMRGAPKSRHGMSGRAEISVREQDDQKPSDNMKTTSDTKPNQDKTQRATNTLASPADHDTVARTAYELWEKEGRQPGHDLEYWVRAEQIIQARRTNGPNDRKSPTTSVAPVIAKKGNGGATSSSRSV